MTKIKKRILLAAAAVLGITTVCLCAAGLIRGREYTPTVSERIANYDEVIGAIRHGLKMHSSCITVRFYYPGDMLEELSDVVGDWVEEALEETNDPAEGDYIRYQYDGYSINCGYDTEPDGRRLYTVEISPRYYMYLFQEEAVTERLGEVLTAFGFDETTSDYQKVRTIYDYICSHVRYDYVRRKNTHQHMNSTAYGALIQQTATCQGYCALLYRMLRETGIDCRIVTGTAYSAGRAEFHAWNIAKLDGKYYNLDATWDSGREEYLFFLRGTANFRDHEAGAEFRAKAFTSRYPMAKNDWDKAE